MSNFLLKDPECVLIHIPKTGGSTIRRGVWADNYDGPEFWTIPDEWNQYFKFAFVRHPLERFVSAWADFTQLRTYQGTIDDFVDVVTDESVIFDERRKTAKERIRHHTIPQTHPFNCLQMADFVGRHENYLADLEYVLKRVGKKAETIPAIRKTAHDGWRSVLSGENLSRLIEFYEKDFDDLGYAKP